MSDLTEKKRTGKRIWLAALLINGIILAAMMIFVPMVYETNDDYAIATRILSGDLHAGYINYYLCIPLVALQKILPAVNIFVLTQIAASFAAFVCISRVMFEMNRNAAFRIMFVLIEVLYAFDHYSVIQFTKTSGLVAVAGMLMLADALTRKRGISFYIWGVVLLWLATAIRYEMIIFAIAFAGLYLLFWIIGERKRLKPEGYLGVKSLIAFALVLILMGGTVGLQYLSEAQNSSTEELRDYNAYNYNRSIIVDFPVKEHFRDHPEAYRDIDVDANDMDLISNWYLDYDGAASPGQLKAIVDVYQSKGTDGVSFIRPAKKCLKEIYHDMRGLSMGGIHILLLFGLALTGLVVLRPRHWIYIGAVGLSAVATYYVIYYMGRPAYRTTYIIDLAATVWLLYYFDPSRFRKSRAGRAGGSGAGETVLPDAPISGFARIGGSILCGLLGLALLGGIYLGYERSLDKHETLRGQIRPEALTQRIREDKNHVYVFNTREKRNLSTYASPLSAPAPDGNVFSFGSWGTKSPWLTGRLSEYGLSNVFGDIIDNEQVYVIEDRNVEKMEKYLNRWYSEYVGAGRLITYEPVDEIDGYQIWSVVTGPADSEDREESAPQEEDGAPQGEDAAPQEEDTAPQEEDTAPQEEDTAPQEESEE